MILGSHNSWSFLPVRRWWMKPIAFMAKCQSVDIQEQYELGVRCFDLRVRFDGNILTLVHGIVEYRYDLTELLFTLLWLDLQEDCYVRVLHDVRNKRQADGSSTAEFRRFCARLEEEYPHIRFWCGRNLYDWQVDYDFGIYPTCEERYASVCKPRILDDWWPWIYARLQNKKILEHGTDKDILLVDFIDINNLNFSKQNLHIRSTWKC